MNRGDYLKMRNAQHINIGTVYTYYSEKRREKGQDVLPESIFTQTFPMYMQFAGEEVISHLDKEFKVQVLSDKDGTFLKAF